MDPGFTAPETDRRGVATAQVPIQVGAGAFCLDPAEPRVFS